MKRIMILISLIISFQVSLVAKNDEPQKAKVPPMWRLRALWKATNEASRAHQSCLDRACAKELAEFEETRKEVRTLQEKGMAAAREARGKEVHGRFYKRQQAHRVCSANKCLPEKAAYDKLARRRLGMIAILDVGILALLSSAFAASEQ